MSVSAVWCVGAAGSGAAAGAGAKRSQKEFVLQGHVVSPSGRTGVSEATLASVLVGFSDQFVLQGHCCVSPSGRVVSLRVLLLAWSEVGKKGTKT